MNQGFELNVDGLEALVGAHAPERRKAELESTLESIRQEFTEEQDADQQTLERNWRAWTKLHERRDLMDRSVEVACKVRDGFRAYVHVGIGGSDLGPRVSHEVLDGTMYNELPDYDRGTPRVYFAGDTFDPRPLRELLDLLERQDLLDKTAFNIVSRSGKTPETLCAFLAIKDRLDANWMRQTIFTTAENPGESILFDMAKGGGEGELLGVLPVPEGVGGRFSVPSPVGLLPLAVTAPKDTDPRIRVDEAMAGYGAAHDRMLGLSVSDPANLAFRLAYWLQLAEEQLGVGSLVFYDYSACRMLGDWLVQLYTESIQERGGGLNVIGARGPTSNHSLLNGIIGGPRDKVVLFLQWDDLGDKLDVPADPSIQEELGIFMGREMASLQEASLHGAMTDFNKQGVPAMRLNVPRRDAECLFFTMRVLMDAVAIKGRLQGLHVKDASTVDFPNELTYLQHGVEGYKQAMRDYLAGE